MRRCEVQLNAIRKDPQQQPDIPRVMKNVNNSEWKRYHLPACNLFQLQRRTVRQDELLGISPFYGKANRLKLRAASSRRRDFHGETFGFSHHPSNSIWRHRSFTRARFVPADTHFAEELRESFRAENRDESGIAVGGVSERVQRFWWHRGTFSRIERHPFAGLHNFQPPLQDVKQF